MIEFEDDALLKPEATFITGEWVSGNTTFEVFDPATWQPVARVPDLGELDVLKAVDGATHGAAELKTMTEKRRGELLRAWRNLVKAAKEDLTIIITAENGKPIAEAGGEVTYASDFIDWCAGEALRTDGCAVSASNPSNRVVTIKQPVGVCGIITPWNFPSAMVTRKVAAALAAGCPCVVKPAPDTRLTALVIANLTSRAGFPPGSLSVVTNRANTIEVGRALTQHPAIHKFSSTVSTAIWKLLSAQCTSTMKTISLELGGNAPFIVFDDADLQKAADAIVASKFRLSGQTIEKLRLGPGHNAESTIMGPLITNDAVAKVDSHIKDALSRGSRALIRGIPETSLGGAFFQPMLLVDVPADALCAREETFGPLLPMFRFGADAEGVTRANAS